MVLSIPYDDGGKGLIGNTLHNNGVKNGAYCLLDLLCIYMLECSFTDRYFPVESQQVILYGSKRSLKGDTFRDKEV